MKCPKCNKECRKLGNKQTCTNPDCPVVVAAIVTKDRLGAFIRQKKRKEVHTMQRGFTLIELLVVIAILGIIAAVVALNVGNFFDPARVTAANVEAKQVQTAVIAYVADSDECCCFNATIGPEQNYPVNATIDQGIHHYLVTPRSLQAIYQVSHCGITGATLIEGSRWGNITFCDGVWQEGECTG